MWIAPQQLFPDPDKRQKDGENAPHQSNDRGLAELRGHACVTWRARDVRKPQAGRALPVLSVCVQDLQVAGPYHKLAQTRQRELRVGVQVQDLAWR